MSIIILTFVIGILLMSCGFLIWKKQRIEIIRDRHHRNVEDKQGYCRVMGKTVAAMGGLITLSGIMGLIPGLPGWISTMIFYIGIIASVAGILFIQFRYNGGI